MRKLAILFAALLIGCEANEVPITSSSMPDVAVPLDGLEIVLSNYFSDPDGDPLIFDARSSDPSLISTAIRRELLTLRALGNRATPVMIEVTARDPEGATASSSFLASGTTVFYEPWDTEAALDSWNIRRVISVNENPGLDSATVEVHDGLLYMYSASTTPLLRGISVNKLFPTHEKNWKFSTSAWLYSRNSFASTCIDIDIFTGDETYPRLSVAFDFAGFWRVTIAQSGIHDRLDPYWVLLYTDEVGVEKWGPTGFGVPIEQAVNFEISFVEQVLTLTYDDTEIASFKLTDLTTYYTHPDTPDLVWPPASGLWPSSAVGMEISNSPWCGGEYNYPPNRGRNRDDRNNLVVDWIRFEAAGS